MKKPKYKSLSQAVFDRIQEKKRKRLSSATNAGLIVIILLSMGFSVFMSYRQKAAAERATVPTWAQFKINPPGDASKQIFESVESHYADGVPISLSINGEAWSIIRVDSFNDAVGKKLGESFNGTQAETYCEHKTIAYIPTADPRLLRANLMHEVFHAGDCVHGGDTWWNSIDPTRTEHIGVYHLGEFMAVFVHDNPEFMEWEEKW